MTQRDDEAGGGRSTRWHIDRGINVAMLAALAGQFAWFSFQSGQAVRTLAEHDRRLSAVESQRIAERMVAVEGKQVELSAQVAETKAVMLRMESKLDRVIERSRVER